MSNGIKVRLFEAGYCVHPGCMVKPGTGLKPKKFPAGTAVIHHPKRGYLLFDTGYHARFAECTEQFPERLYALTTPHTLRAGQSLKEQLPTQGIQIKQIQYVFLSHFHADHVAGVYDFQHAKIFCHSYAYDYLKEKGRIGRLRKGYLKDLLPKHIEQQLQFINEFPLELNEILDIKTSSQGLKARDLFGDQLLYAVYLPGHAAGQMGLLARLEKGFMFFLADACWLKESLEQNVDQHWLANILCDSVKEYKDTLQKLRNCYKKTATRVTYVPSHCETTFNKLMQQQWID